MILPYSLRLLLVSLAVFFLMNFALAVLAGYVAPFAWRIAQRISARRAATLFFALRVLPAAAALLFVLALGVPSYVALEPADMIERVGWVCIALAAGGAALWAGAAWRGANALLWSLAFARRCRRTAREMQVASGAEPVLVIEHDAPLVALVGLLRPWIVVSTAVLRALTAEQLELAIAHEWAHRDSRENLKRLALAFTPDALPGVRLLDGFERGWARFAEWCADDRAHQGDGRRSATLASALVDVARLGGGPQLSPLSTSLLSPERDLRDRVERLVGESKPEAAGRISLPQRALVAAAVALIGFAAIQPKTFRAVHEMLEFIIRQAT